MTSYLIVNQWQGDKLNHPNMVERFKRVSVFGAKARSLARQYATELNGGKDFSVDKAEQLYAIQNNKEWYTVVAVPDSQARESFNYYDFEKCEFYEPGHGSMLTTE